jgi:hypothetical protein
MMTGQPVPKSPAKTGVGKLLIPEEELTVDKQDFLSPHREGDFPKSPKNRSWETPDPGGGVDS